MKHGYAVICLCILSVLLWGCARRTHTSLPATSPEETETVSETALQETSVPELPPELTAFDQVFCGTRAITRAFSGESIMLSDISLFFTVDELPWRVVQVAILDLDSDEVLEAVLEVENHVGFVILEYQDGTVLGTEIWYRAFRDLKEDGSFSGSGSSFNRNYWQYAFSGNILLAERYAAEDGSPCYTLFGEEAEEATFYTFEAQQQSKPAATWYPDWQDYLASRQDSLSTILSISP